MAPRDKASPEAKTGKPARRKPASPNPRLPGYEEALALLFPDVPPEDRTRIGQLPTGWTPWQRPSYQNLSRFDAKTRQMIEARKPYLSNLDDEIERLIGGRRDALIANSERCPFHGVRYAIAIAAGWGKKTADAETQQRPILDQRQKKHRDFMIKQAKALEYFFFDPSNPDRFINSETAPMDAYGIAKPDDGAINAQLIASSGQLALIKAAIGALRTLAATVESKRKRRPLIQDNQHPWEEGFIQSLGREFRALTGDAPPISETSDFVSFTNCAYAAIGGHEDGLPGKSFTRAIRLITGTRDGRIPRAPDHDQFDVYADLPKATPAEIEAAREKRRIEKAERWKEEMHGYAKLLKSDDSNERATGLALLKGEYQRIDAWPPPGLKAVIARQRLGMFPIPDEKAFIESLVPDEVLAWLRSQD